MLPGTGVTDPLSAKQLELGKPGRRPQCLPQLGMASMAQTLTKGETP